ncbi:MAG: hypothetical protein ACI9YT_002781 [Halobacteriales archaeon]|jgi:hypothetical protein
MYFRTMSSTTRTSTSGARRSLFALTAVAQILSGFGAAYLTSVVVPDARETFRPGRALLGYALEPVVVPVGLALGAYLLVRRIGVPGIDRNAIVVLFAISFVAFYVGFWGVAIPIRSVGQLPLQDHLPLRTLFEWGPYLPYAWSNFLIPGIEGGLATLAGAGAVALRSD